MLDFAFGPNGYGLTDGMRKEQDRITQNRMQFANNMATFLANNPYITPEAAQAFINSAAGTDNTLRGSVPNQLISQINQENARVRRIDTFKAFNEFTRLNPGATAAEFQAAMSAFGAQGIVGEDFIKAIQGRADQYRKDQETVRQMKMAQEIGATRNSMMNDIEYQASALGYDPAKVVKAMKDIYGDAPPVPYETLINPGSMEVMRNRVIQENLPKAIEILNASPNMPMELLAGAFPALQGSPVIKSIYDAAQTERKKAVQDTFYKNKKQIVDSIAQSHLLGTDVQKAYEEAVRGAGISAADLGSLDGNAIMAEAKALADKTKADEQQKLDGVLAAAKGKMFSEVRTNTLADANTMQALANGDISSVESLVRARIRDESGLTEAQLAKIPDSYYSSLAQSIQQQLVNKFNSDQAALYDKIHGQGPDLSKALRDQNAKIAEGYQKPSIATAIANAGLNETLSGAVIPSIMSGVGQTYDLSNGGAERLFDALLQVATENPDAGMAIREAAIKMAGLQPITSVVNDQIDTLAKRSGAVSRTPRPATEYVTEELRAEAKAVDAQIGQVKSMAAAKDKLPDAIIAELTSFRSQVEASIASNPETVIGLLQNNAWSSVEDRFSQSHMKKLLEGYSSEGQRLLDYIDNTIAALKAQDEAQRNQNLSTADALRPPVSSQNSPAYNTLVAPLAPTPNSIEIGQIRREILQSMPAVPNSNTPVIGGLIDMLNPSNFLNSQEEVDLTAQLAAIANDPSLLNKIRQNPMLRSLIKSNPQQLIQALTQAQQ